MEIKQRFACVKGDGWLSFFSRVDLHTNSNSNISSTNRVVKAMTIFVGVYY